MWSLFKKQKKQEEPVGEIIDFSFLGCDMHSHLVPGVDDGAKTPEDSLDLIRRFKEKGYKKLITTPHVHGEFYDNNSEKLRRHFADLQRLINDHHIQIELGISAEYFLDNYFMDIILPEGLLSFGDNYVLVEVSMAGWPRNFSDLIFSVQSLGYKPILAHPERYQYEEGAQLYHELKDKGIMLQMNLLSVLGYYGRQVKNQAELLLKEKLYDFCGSDLHHSRHMDNLHKMINDHPGIMHQLRDYGFRNPELLAH
ncbi:tyrosine-protein phosphatase [Taibaiella soli]|uniref:protein-tyrosine-phosphatase n=1 Tax=Taibaiella soli TaxID=1649169 RepID=A0A2W2B729_9BACT|nr:CpsB/CapC family capsule biosynthesis tyrosine phosphatase [Taibaiella soli]PZF72049.1 capsular biosynthesis protein [Taibaiella soli]